jgi:hypothetical protein
MYVGRKVMIPLYVNPRAATDVKNMIKLRYDILLKPASDSLPTPTLPFFTGHLGMVMEKNPMPIPRRPNITCGAFHTIADPIHAERAGTIAIPRLPAIPLIPKALPFSLMPWEINVLDAG